MRTKAIIGGMIFCCRPDNDLYRVLAELGIVHPRYDGLLEALEAAPSGAGVLALADDYPRPSVTYSERLASLARSKGLRLYLEYPAALPGLSLGKPRPTRWERVVVSSRFFLPALAPHTILAQHGCWYLPVQSSSAPGAEAVEPSPSPGPWQPGQGDAAALRREPSQGGSGAVAPDGPLNTPKLPHGAAVALAVARVAGYDRAVYGLPEDALPILFELADDQLLVATSKLSQFVTGRYGPQSAWKAIWERLLGWLDPSGDVPELAWTPTVRIQAGPQTPLGDEAEENALCRSVKWFRENVVYSIDWKKGAIEGFESAIDHKGRQMRRTWVRGDCTAEAGMVFAFDWALTRNPDSQRLATQILDYAWSAPDFYQDDPRSPAYGLSNWYERGPVFYGDDNARVIIPTLVARHLLHDGRWDERVLRCLLANLRTTGALGFRRNRIDLHHLQEDGQSWASFYDERTLSYAPHYQAYLWAAYLLAYALTGFGGYIDRTRKAIRMTMDAYPGWQWTNGFTQEMARMLLPLAFLVRIEDRPKHRAWLDRIAGDLLAHMQPCGVIHEWLGPLENGRYAPPRTNEAYGTTEASLIQANGDPACDLLYTANYAFLGLHEAAAAGGNGAQEAEDQLADLFCRIQVRSKAHPYLDGAWMRSFDDERWEYWGSSADAGWGAWSVESGWTNTWIAAVLAMRQSGTSLYDLATAVRMEEHSPALVVEMLGRR